MEVLIQLERWDNSLEYYSGVGGLSHNSVIFIDIQKKNTK